jgi:hypothetical protein
MSPPHDIGGAVEAYAAYLNAPRGFLDSEEQVLFDQDMARARAAMERAWLEATPVLEAAAPAAASISPRTWAQRFLAPLSALRRVLARA